MKREGAEFQFILAGKASFSQVRLTKDRTVVVYDCYLHLKLDFFYITGSIMTATILDLPRKFPWPTLLSVAIHGAVIAGVLFVSARQTVQLPAPSQPISVTMIAPADLEPAQPTVAPPPEPAVDPAPEPAPIVESKQAPVVIHKPKPKPKLKPKPVHKTEKTVQREEPREPRISDVRNDAARSAPANANPAPAATPVQSAPGGPHALSRTQPQYPTRAYALRLEGNVRVKFDVTNDGRVDNVAILSANPQNMFEREVKQAMKRWRYQPGRPGQGLVVNIIFKINGGAQLQ